MDVFYTNHLLGGWNDGNESSLLEVSGEQLYFLGAELYRAGDTRVKRVIGAAFDVLARADFGAALANEDHAGLNRLAVEALDAKALGYAVAAQAG